MSDPDFIATYPPYSYNLFPPQQFLPQKAKYNSMKKLKHSHGSGKRFVKYNNAPKESSLQPKLDSIDEDDQGFGGWLKSEDGVENMKLFVIANTIVLLTTMTYPHIQTLFGMISDALYGADGVL